MFADGGELIELEGGTLVIREHKRAKHVPIGAERPIRYNDPRPPVDLLLSGPRWAVAGGLESLTHEVDCKVNEKERRQN